MHKLHSVTTIRLIARMCSGFIAACSICFTAGWKCKGCRRPRRHRLAPGAVLRLATLDAKAGGQWGRPHLPLHPSPTLETTVAGFRVSRVSRVFCGPSLLSHTHQFFLSRVVIEKKPGNPATQRNLLLSKDLTSGFLQKKTRQKPGNPAETTHPPQPRACGHAKRAAPACRPLRFGHRIGSGLPVCYNPPFCVLRVGPALAGWKR